MGIVILQCHLLVVLISAALLIILETFRDPALGVSCLQNQIFEFLMLLNVFRLV